MHRRLVGRLGLVRVDLPRAGLHQLRSELGALLARILDIAAVDAPGVVAVAALVLTLRALRLLGQQLLAIGDRDLVVVRMDFREGQEAVAIATVLDERRLERRLDAHHLGEVDVALELLLA